MRHSDCEAKEKARQKYSDASPKTRIDEVETEEEAEEYLQSIRELSEKGKTTRLP